MEENDFDSQCFPDVALRTHRVFKVIFKPIEIKKRTQSQQGKEWVSNYSICALSRSVTVNIPSHFASHESPGELTC